MIRQMRQAFSLATRDYVHEWQMSACFVLALAAVLGPMMVLFGLKFGIVGSMVAALVDDPRNREVRPVGSGHFEQAWFEQMAQRQDVAFVVPKTRSIAASIQLAAEASAEIVDAEIIPSAGGDPVLPGLPLVAALDQVVVSQTVADKLNLKLGDKMDGSLARQFQGTKERVHLPLKVAAIAPAIAFAREGVFVSVELMQALEDYRDGHAVPSLKWTGNPPPLERSFPGFRLYARSIYDVAGLRDGFAKAGINVATQAAEIETVQRMDATLSGIYWAIAVIGLGGFSLSLGASLWANVERKRKELSVLRLVGFRTGHITWFPVLQAAYTGVLGWLLALGIYQGAAMAINHMLAPQLNAGQQVCSMLAEHFYLALLLTLAAAVLSAALAGLKASRIEPSEGMREL